MPDVCLPCMKHLKGNDEFWVKGMRSGMDGVGRSKERMAALMNGKCYRAMTGYEWASLSILCVKFKFANVCVCMYTCMYV